MSAGFQTPLVVELTDDGLWVLTEDLIWSGSQGDTLLVHAGEETDFASVPRILQGIMPATGTWTRAAVVHDMLCRELNDYHRDMELWAANFWLYHKLGEMPDPKPEFNAVDTDAVFRKIMKADGTSWIMRQIGWTGVRWGALVNPARRAGWLSTAPAVLGFSVAMLGAVAAVVAGVSAVLPW